MTFIILCFEGAILSFNVAASAALVPSVALDFSVPQFVAGRIVWLYMIPYGIAALIYGPLVRFFDAKKIELVCFGLFTLSNLFAFYSWNITALLVSRVLMGLFGASVIPLILILISRHAKPTERGKKVGVFFSATFVASLLGLFLSGIIHWRMIFLIPALLGFVLLIAMYAYLPSFKEDKRIFGIHYLKAFQQKSILSLFTYIFFISLFYHGIQQWLGVYFSTTFNFSQFVISMLITLTSLSGIFGEIAGGILADSVGRIKTVQWGILLMIASVSFLLFKLHLVYLILIMIAWGLGWTLNHAGISTVLTDLPKEFLNEAASLNSSVRFIAGGVGAALAGVLMQINFRIGFMVLGCGLAILFVLSKKLLFVQSGGSHE